MYTKKIASSYITDQVNLMKRYASMHPEMSLNDAAMEWASKFAKKYSDDMLLMCVETGKTRTFRQWSYVLTEEAVSNAENNGVFVPVNENLIR
jgi:hypothetical protein